MNARIAIVPGLLSLALLAACGPDSGGRVLIPTGGAAFGLPTFTTCRPASDLLPTAPLQGPLGDYDPSFVPDRAFMETQQLVQVQIEIIGIGARTRSAYPAPNLNDNITALFLEPTKDVPVLETFCGGGVCGFVDEYFGGGTAPPNEDAPAPPPVVPVDDALLAACPELSPDAVVPMGTALMAAFEAVRIEGDVATLFYSDRDGDPHGFTPPSGPVADVAVTWAEGWPRGPEEASGSVD